MANILKYTVVQLHYYVAVVVVVVRALYLIL